ncbi:unnamed protein product [Dovyalis caffra]|uniref:Maturase K n=1 Tax=Dovyalis caffra TaxID=77055 RepID=A0AAV1RBF7_9ROSI|nr:unnamed protein product [Dovyalis caffra]
MDDLISLSLEAEETYFEGTWFTLFPELNTFSPPPLLQEFYLHGGLIEMPVWLASMENLAPYFIRFLSIEESNFSPSVPKLKLSAFLKATKQSTLAKNFAMLLDLKHIFNKVYHPPLSCILRLVESQ